jgi:hypothetical protein
MTAAPPEIRQKVPRSPDAPDHEPSGEHAVPHSPPGDREPRPAELLREAPGQPCADSQYQERRSCVRRDNNRNELRTSTRLHSHISGKSKIEIRKIRHEGPSVLRAFRLTRWHTATAHKTKISGVVYECKTDR